MGLFKKSTKLEISTPKKKRYICEMALACQMANISCWHSKVHLENERDDTCNSGKTMCSKALYQGRIKVVKKGCIEYGSDEY